MSESAPGADPDSWDRAAAWLAKHGSLPALGVLTVVAAFIYAHVFRGEIVGDDLTFHMAEARRIADCIAAGDWDFWNPSANGGFASLYYYQAVPQLASAIPAALFGDFVFWFQLSVFLPHVLAPAAAYRGTRLLGATPWQAFGAAVAVAMISGQSRWGTGADGTFQVGLYTQTWALAAFPLALGHGARWISDGKGLPAAIAWGAFVTLCHPFAGISLGIVLVIGAAFHLLASLAAELVRSKRLAVAVGCGTGVALAAAVSVLVSPRAGALTGIVLITLSALHSALAAITDRVPPGKLLVLAGCFAGFAINAVLLVARWQSLYLVPVSLFGAAAARLGWELATQHHTERARFAPLFGAEVPRLVVLGVAMLLAALPVWLTVLVDYDGFGGFPHRVNDEVGPGYTELMKWQVQAALLDFKRPPVLTWLIPAVILLGRARYLRWLWMPAAAFAVLLAVGPHMPKTADDLLPAVRFLGALQIVLAMAAGAGAIAIGAQLWNAPDGSLARRATRIGAIAVLCTIGGVLVAVFAFSSAASDPMRLVDTISLHQLSSGAVRALGILIVAFVLTIVVPLAWRGTATAYGVRTALSALVAALAVLVVVQGATVLGQRVRVLGDYQPSYRGDMMALIDAIEQQPQGRRQVATGAENHWWNLLPYVYARRPALLQMGGGGLQASPNYDFVWSVRDFAKLAWVYDTPYLVFTRASAKNQPAGETIAESEAYELRRLTAPGLVSPIQITGLLPAGRKEARAAAIAWLRTEDPLANRHLAYDGAGPPGAPPHARVLRTGRTESPGDHADLFAYIDAAEPSTFVFRESWHPRWRAYLDGAPVPIRRVTPDFPAVDAPAGRHLLQLRFERPWWAHAAWLAWPGIPLLAWLALRVLRRPRDR